jgi:hypothetical protein
MSGVRFRRPSPALIVAVVALVMAMAGTGYAALKLPNNSVGTKQLKNNAVTGAKVKQGSLEGGDIKLSTLGTVPTATKADSAETATRAASAESAARANTATNADHAMTADSASSIPAAGPIRLVGAPGEPPFLSGSVNRPAPEPSAAFQPAGFYKDHEGVVHLEGVVTAGKEGSAPGLMFVLPPGYRPAPGMLLTYEQASQRGVLIGGTGTELGGIDLSGAVYATETEMGSIPLSGITFLAQG